MTNPRSAADSTITWAALAIALLLGLAGLNGIHAQGADKPRAIETPDPVPQKSDSSPKTEDDKTPAEKRREERTRRREERAQGEKPAARAADALDQKIPGVTETSDIAYIEGKDRHERHVLDLYMPEGKKDVPVIVFFHGGAWFGGDKRHGKALARGLASLGYGVASPSYRLARMGSDDAVKFPAFVEDAAAAFAWVHKNIKQYGGNPERLFLAGHSAGGHISGVLATNETFLKKHELDHQAVVKGYIGISGVYDLIEPGPMLDYAFPPDEASRIAASPIKHVDHKDPITLLLYAETELLTLDQMARKMHEHCKTCEHGCEIHCIKGRNHETILREFGTQDDEACRLMAEFLKKRLETVAAEETKAKNAKPADGVAKPETKPNSKESAK